MPRLILVRHGEASAGWGDARDPGLSDLGRAQAEAVAEVLAPQGPVPVITSPLRRTRETAAPLARRWGLQVVVEPRVGEIRTPVAEGQDRSEWLGGVLASRWSQLDDELQAWADDVVRFLVAVEEDAVVVSHFVAINVAIGRATGDDRVVAARIGNGSRTVVEITGDGLALVEPPQEVVSTEVL